MNKAEFVASIADASGLTKADAERAVEGVFKVVKKTLKAGESKQVTFQLGFPELSFYNVKSQPVIEPTHYTVWVGGSSLATGQADFDVVP